MAPASDALALLLFFSLDPSRVSALVPGALRPHYHCECPRAASPVPSQEWLLVRTTKNSLGPSRCHNYTLANLLSVKHWRIDLLTAFYRTYTENVNHFSISIPLISLGRHYYFYLCPTHTNTAFPPLFLPLLLESTTIFSLHDATPWYLVSIRTTKHTRHYHLPRATCVPF